EAGWAGMPDEIIILDDFKKEVSGKTVIKDPTTGAIIREDIGDTTAGVGAGGEYFPGAIANTALEMRLMDNPTTNNQNPGLIQVLDSTWPIAKKLDMCIPGPNKGWELKLDQERERVEDSKLTPELGSTDYEKVKAVYSVKKDLEFAVRSFKDWITTKMIGALPSSILFIDAIKEMDTNSQQYKELTDKLREKRTALARLNAIELSLKPIITQPLPNTQEEKNLIGIRKQFNAVAASIASTVSIDELQSQLALAGERKQNLLLLESQCKEERATAGWNSPGGATSFYNPGGTGILNPTTGGQPLQTEQQLFCDIPIVSGYSHGEVIRNDSANGPQLGTPNYFTFRNDLGYILGNPGYTDLPMVNAVAVYGDITCTGTCSWAGPFGRDPKDKRVSVDIECGLLFKVNDNDYKHAGDELF
ncbi:MAG: hypothetical protein AAB815_00820, partial [Patescibacteria group bacterium]